MYTLDACRQQHQNHSMSHGMVQRRWQRHGQRLAACAGVGPVRIATTESHEREGAGIKTTWQHHALATHLTKLCNTHSTPSISGRVWRTPVTQLKETFLGTQQQPDELQTHRMACGRDPRISMQASGKWADLASTWTMKAYILLQCKRPEADVRSSSRLSPAPCMYATAEK